jgi:hypothetical protein
MAPAAADPAAADKQAAMGENPPEADAKGLSLGSIVVL